MPRYPTLVLLPGMHGTGDLFPPFLEVLPSNIHPRVIAYPTDEILSLAQLSHLIETELKDETDLVLVGESFSGPLALQFAVDHPQRTRALILSATFVTPPLPSWLRFLVSPLLMRLPMPGFAIRFLVAGPEVPTDFVDTIRQAIRKPLPEVLAHRAREVLSLDYRSALRACKVPILYLAPTHDHMVPRRSLKAILAIRPDVQAAHIEGPHLILQAKPKTVCQVITSFIAER